MPSTLRSSRDIRAVFAERFVAHGHALSLHGRPRGGGGPARSTVVAGRKVGNAVARNRAKRRLRAVVEDAGRRGEGLPDGLDVVVVAKQPAARIPYPALVQDFAGARGRLLDRMGRQR